MCRYCTKRNSSDIDPIGDISLATVPPSSATGRLGLQGCPVYHSVWPEASKFAIDTAHSRPGAVLSAPSGRVRLGEHTGIAAFIPGASNVQRWGLQVSAIRFSTYEYLLWDGGRARGPGKHRALAGPAQPQRPARSSVSGPGVGNLKRRGTGTQAAALTDTLRVRRGSRVRQPWAGGSATQAPPGQCDSELWFGIRVCHWHVGSPAWI